MKRLRFYISLILTVCIFASLCPMAFAAQKYDVLWSSNPLTGVDKYVYSATAYGFIIQDYSDGTAKVGLINETGLLIPPGERHFTEVDKGGFINYSIYHDNAPTEYGVMDIHGNTPAQFAKYSAVRTITNNRYQCFVYGENSSQCGIIDAAGNEIVPVGKYEFDWECTYWNYGTFRVYNEEGQMAVIDCNGNFISQFGSEEDIRLTAAADRYLVYDDTEKVSYIRALDGSNIAEIPGEARFVFYNFIEVENYNPSTKTLKVFCYGLDGKLVKTDVYENFGGRPFTFYDIYDMPKYTSDYDYNSGSWNVFDAQGNRVYTAEPSWEIKYVYDNGLVNVGLKDDYAASGLVDLNGNAVVPIQANTTIYYCKGRDIFAFENDQSGISIAKITTPITVTLSGRNIEFDQPPVAKQGRTLVPVRAIFEALGATVDWDNATQTVTAKRGSVTVTLTLGSNIMTVDGAKIEIDVPAEALNGRTLVPVRAISEAFGCNVEWEQATRTVIIN